MTIEPLTITLYGFSAVHYARVTGTTLHRCEVLRAHGASEPARIVTPDEAHALIQRDQSEHRTISCGATHGERPYRSAGPVEIDWPAIHAAALVVDAERRGPAVYSRAFGGPEHAYFLGHDYTCDAFGGSYFPESYELAGLAGVVRILDGAQKIRHAAWDAIHRAHRVPDGHRLAACALRTALALDHLFRALAATDVYVYEPSAQICGVTGYEPTDAVQVTGMRWLAGAEVDREAPTMREVGEFLRDSAS